MLLAQNPQVREQLNAELNTVLNGRPPTVADLPQLTYADWLPITVVPFGIMYPSKS
ncbi:MAG: hypothetical protein AAGL17_08330 [Cyanobacteria bacterium J06576_12]